MPVVIPRRLDNGQVLDPLEPMRGRELGGDDVEEERFGGVEDHRDDGLVVLEQEIGDVLRGGDREVLGEGREGEGDLAN